MDSPTDKCPTYNELVAHIDTLQKEVERLKFKILDLTGYGKKLEYQIEKDHGDCVKCNDSDLKQQIDCQAKEVEGLKQQNYEERCTTCDKHDSYFEGEWKDRAEKAESENAGLLDRINEQNKRFANLQELLTAQANIFKLFHGE